jgi:hypothetical protein
MAMIGPNKRAKLGRRDPMIGSAIAVSELLQLRMAPSSSIAGFIFKMAARWRARRDARILPEDALKMADPVFFSELRKQIIALAARKPTRHLTTGVYQRVTNATTSGVGPDRQLPGAFFANFSAWPGAVRGGTRAYYRRTH